MAKISFGLFANVMISQFPTDQFASGKPIFVCTSLGFKYVQNGESDETEHGFYNTPCPLCGVRDAVDDSVIIAPIVDVHAKSHVHASPLIVARISYLARTYSYFDSQAPPASVI